MSVDTLRKRILTASLILLLCVPLAFAEQVFGKVVSVADGDTITVFTEAGNINEKMVQLGYAWVYRKYAKKPEALWV